MSDTRWRRRLRFLGCIATVGLAGLPVVGALAGPLDPVETVTSLLTTTSLKVEPTVTLTTTPTTTISTTLTTTTLTTTSTTATSTTATSTTTASTAATVTTEVKITTADTQRAAPSVSTVPIPAPIAAFIAVVPEPPPVETAVPTSPPRAELTAALLQFLTADERGLATVVAGPLILLSVLVEALTAGSSWLVAASSLVASVAYLAVRFRRSVPGSYQPA